MRLIFFQNVWKFETLKLSRIHGGDHELVAMWRGMPEAWPGRWTVKFYIFTVFIFRYSLAICISNNHVFERTTNRVMSNKLVWYIQCLSNWLQSGWVSGDRGVWRASTEVIHCVFDQILNLQNCFTPSPPPQTKTYEGRGPQTDKHLPPSHFTYKFLRKADI